MLENLKSTEFFGTQIFSNFKTIVDNFTPLLCLESLVFANYKIHRSEGGMFEPHFLAGNHLLHLISKSSYL